MFHVKHNEIMTSNSDNMENINKWKAFKIVFFFIVSLIIITGTLSAVIKTYFDTGFKYIYLQFYLCSNYCINNCNYFKSSLNRSV